MPLAQATFPRKGTLSKNQFSRCSYCMVLRFAYMEGRAFRHGDIVRALQFASVNFVDERAQEDVLEEIKKSSGFAIGALIGKGKFSGLDIKRVYFGCVPHLDLEVARADAVSSNWLRDYSQVGQHHRNGVRSLELIKCLGR